MDGAEFTGEASLVKREAPSIRPTDNFHEIRLIAMDGENTGNARSNCHVNASRDTFNLSHTVNKGIFFLYEL